MSVTFSAEGLLNQVRDLSQITPGIKRPDAPEIDLIIGN